jgi:RNA polymerase primary sigma factor
MFDHLKWLVTPGLGPGNAGAWPAVGRARGDAATVHSPWHCPVPTLEGQPRSALAPSGASQKEALRPTLETPLAEESGGRSRSAAAGRGDGDDFLLRLYLRDALREPLLSPTEEAVLGWGSTFDDETAREGLVLGNLRLVIHLAFECRRPGVSLCDLINEGNMALMRAAELFEPGYGRRFASYAAPWIRQSMRRAVGRLTWPVRLPASLLSRPGLRWAGQAQLALESDVEPTMSGQLPVGSGRCPTWLSLDSPLAGDEEGLTLGDGLADERTLPPDLALVRRGDCEFAGQLLTLLKPREQQVLRLRFGLEDGCQRSLDEVGRKLGYVRQGIHRIESAALDKLRRHALFTARVRRCPASS